VHTAVAGIAVVPALSGPRRDVLRAGVRTELESIVVSLREQLDAEAGERTEPEGAFADTAVAAGPPSADNLVAFEGHLLKLAENAERATVRSQLESAHESVATDRTGHRA
jgi:hypothetical protein